MSADALIIGAGASGLIAAIKCAQSGKKVILLEKEILPGRKILITGNGRCNFTNTKVSPDKYFEAADFTAPALQNFTHKNCVDFFEDIGMLSHADEGRWFPITGKASSVVDCLVNTAISAGIDIRLKTHVVKIEKAGGVFKAHTRDGDIFSAKNLVLACGSPAYPQAGGTAEGYNLAQSLGHTITALSPAISAINLKEKAVARLAGLKVYANAILQGKDSEEGEIIFGANGVSGNNILSISRNALPGDKLLLDFLPQFTEKEFTAFMDKRRKQMRGASVKNFLTGILADNAANLLTDFLGIKKNSLVADLTPDIFARIIKTIKAWPFTVESLRGEKEACAARGGVNRAEIDGRTMQSKKVRGLYITGELLDVDGRCGGYNLHFAWASGVLAAKFLSHCEERSDAAIS